MCILSDSAVLLRTVAHGLFSPPNTVSKLYWFKKKEEEEAWAGEMAQWVKAFTAKSDDLNLTPMMHMKEGDYQFPFNAFWLKYVL